MIFFITRGPHGRAGAIYFSRICQGLTKSMWMGVLSKSDLLELWNRFGGDRVMIWAA